MSGFYGRGRKPPELVSEWLFNVPRSLAYEILPHLNPHYAYVVDQPRVEWRDNADPAVELVRLKRLGWVGIYWRRKPVEDERPAKALPRRGRHKVAP